MKIGCTSFAVALALGAITTIAGQECCIWSHEYVAAQISPGRTWRAAGPNRPRCRNLSADGDGHNTSAEFATASANMVQDLQAKFLAKYDANGDERSRRTRPLAVNQGGSRSNG